MTTGTPTRQRHDCPGDTCRSCNRRIAAAEAERDDYWDDHGAEMDDRAEREVGWR